jgi:hypothetical protein
VVLAEGEAGIGKTRLLAETLTTARGRGMRVAAGRAGELESARPFGVIRGDPAARARLTRLAHRPATWRMFRFSRRTACGPGSA